ncbi:hypothetical protein AeMF1_021564 [Aphanomyces euteiches]|nr:hypothetical protein AeMF1_021564 [Aphanomyces euteiches]KAH9183648.1 hypothetical protein AeNC1_014376 [Aphanomyces euteiches]
MAPTPTHSRNDHMTRREAADAIAGKLYLVVTLTLSAIYLSLLEPAMANDLWWAGFNASGAQSFVIDLYNKKLNLNASEMDLTVAAAAAAVPKAYAQFYTPIEVSPVYPRLVLDAYSADLATIIRGLVTQPGPEQIATQYCWIDLNRTWQVAHTDARQRRCSARYSDNGAVYWESILRLIDWNLYMAMYYGGPFNATIGNALRKTRQGQTWLATTPYAFVDVRRLAKLQDAWYCRHDRHSKRTRRRLPDHQQMFWPFASLLWAVSTPTTSIYRASLLRQTGSRFAFANRTIESILVEDGTLWTSDLTSSAYSIFRRTIGPFGSVDLKHIAVPPSLAKFMLGFRDAANSWRILSEDFGIQYLAILNGPNVGYVPPPWKSFKYTTGGNLLCNDVPAALLTDGPLLFTSVTAACGSNVKETIALSIMMRLFAVIGANLVRSNLTANETTAVCSTLTGVTTAQGTTRIVQMPVQLLLNTSSRARRLVPPRRRDGPVRQNRDRRHNLFDPAFPTFHYAAWSLVYDWGNAYREVNDFQGDSGSVKVITATQADLTSLVNPLEIPVNVATYIRYICYYVTYVIIIVAALATVYLVLSKGYVEGRNLLEINRVAGLVWVGRTFIFVRSLAAICLLSAESLALVTVNQAWRLTSASNVVTNSWNDRVVRNFNIFIAAGELSWLGFVLNDILMVVTAQYTPAYVFKCNFMIWGLAALLSWASPAKHTATMERDCTMPQVDFQLVCSSGTVAIGSFSRLVSLVGICIGSIVVCYLYERLRHPALPPTRQDSLFLAASAKFVFEPHNGLTTM